MKKSKRSIVSQISSNFRVALNDEHGIPIDLTSYKLQALNSKGKWTYIKYPPQMRLIRLEPNKKDLKKQ